MEPPREDQRRRIPTEDKVLFFILALCFAGAALGLLFGIKYIADLFGLLIAASSEGVGFRSAFLTSLGVSFFFILSFALIGGDGVVGELGLMLVGFFLMLVFFTITIAVIF